MRCRYLEIFFSGGGDRSLLRRGTFIFSGILLSSLVFGGVSVAFEKRSLPGKSGKWRAEEAALKKFFRGELLKYCRKVKGKVRFLPISDLAGAISIDEREKRIASVVLKIAQIKGYLRYLSVKLAERSQSLRRLERAYKISDLLMTIGTFGLTKLKVPGLPMLLPFTRKVLRESFEIERRDYPYPRGKRFNLERDFREIIKISRSDLPTFSYRRVICFLNNRGFGKVKRCIPEHPGLTRELKRLKSLWEIYRARVRESELPYKLDILFEFVLKDELKRSRAEKRFLEVLIQLLGQQLKFLSLVEGVLLRDYYFWGCRYLSSSKKGGYKL